MKRECATLARRTGNSKIPLPATVFYPLGLPAVSPWLYDQRRKRCLCRYPPAVAAATLILPAVRVGQATYDLQVEVRF